MKLILFLSILFFFNHSLFKPTKDCYDAFYSAGQIYIYSGKAYTSDNYDDLEYYVNKALDAAEDCMYYAEVCDCWNAYYSADEAYSNLKKIHYLSEWNDAVIYIKEAMNNAEEAIYYADECNQEGEE